jgi:hypothetical protein
MYQSGKNIPITYLQNIPNVHGIFQIGIKGTKLPKNRPTFSTPTPSKTYKTLVIFGFKIYHLATLRRTITHQSIPEQHN